MTSSYDAAVVDTALIEDERLLRLPRGIRLLYLEALVWCKAHRSDGRIPPTALRRMTDEPDERAAAGQLVEAGLWRMEADCWVISDYCRHQMTRDRVERKEARAREARDRYEEGRPGRSHHRGDTSPAISPDASASHPAFLPAKAKEGKDGEAPARLRGPAVAPILEETRDPLAQRRELARAIREAQNPDLAQRYRSTFEREYGHLYGRGGSMRSLPTAARYCLHLNRTEVRSVGSEGLSPSPSTAAGLPRGGHQC